jgi:hypothetical protein
LFHDRETVAIAYFCIKGTGQKEKPMGVIRRPTTSGGSQLLEGVLLGVSLSDRNQKSLKLPVFSM